MDVPLRRAGGHGNQLRTEFTSGSSRVTVYVRGPWSTGTTAGGRNLAPLFERCRIALEQNLLPPSSVLGTLRHRGGFSTASVKSVAHVGLARSRSSTRTGARNLSTCNIFGRERICRPGKTATLPAALLRSSRASRPGFGTLPGSA